MIEASWTGDNCTRLDGQRLRASTDDGCAPRRWSPPRVRPAMSLAG